MTSRMVANMTIYHFEQLLLYLVIIMIKKIGVLLLQLELWMIGKDDHDLQDGFYYHY